MQTNFVGAAPSAMEAPVGPADVALLLAVCRGDAEGAAAALAAGASAKRRFRRADAAAALGPEAYLGSQWWATQTNFPLMYFVGAPAAATAPRTPGDRNGWQTRRAAARARPAAAPHPRRALATLVGHARSACRPAFAREDARNRRAALS